MTTPKLKNQAKNRRSFNDAKAPAFWCCELTTVSGFFFTAFGTTKESCSDAMRRALVMHVMAAESLRPDDYVAEIMNSIEPRQVAMGEGYRDGICLTGGK